MTALSRGDSGSQAKHVLSRAGDRDRTLDHRLLGTLNTSTPTKLIYVCYQVFVAKLISCLLVKANTRCMGAVSIQSQKNTAPQMGVGGLDGMTRCWEPGCQCCHLLGGMHTNAH